MDKEQNMQLVNDLFPSLLAGWKQCTIRKGMRDIKPGALTFHAPDGSLKATVNVTEVRHKKLGELTDAEAQADGAENAAHMVAAMKRFYPDIGPDSDITVILFDPYKPALQKKKSFFKGFGL